MVCFFRGWGLGLGFEEAGLRPDSRFSLSMIPLSDHVALYRALLWPRMIEENMLRLLRLGQLSKWFSGIGQEAIAVGVTAALRDSDTILPMHRNLGVFTTRRGRPRAPVAPTARQGRRLHGRPRSHLSFRRHGSSPRRHDQPSGSDAAGGRRTGTGGSTAARDGVAAAFIGDGGTSEGDFHEAVNLAAVWKLPVLFVSKTIVRPFDADAEQFACEDLAARGAGYGMPGLVVDGNDVAAVHRAASEAAARAGVARPDAARVQDVPHARPRGGVGHSVRPADALRRVAGRDPDRPVRAAAR